MADHPPQIAAGVQQVLQQHQQQIQQQLQQQQQQTQQQIQQLLLQHEKMQRAQTTNSFATDDTILEVVSNAAGATPPHWPAKASPAQVSRIPGPHLTQQFYQLPTGGRIADKARRVLMHLGVRPSAAVL